jgi:hypothetical protein
MATADVRSSLPSILFHMIQLIRPFDGLGLCFDLHMWSNERVMLIMIELDRSES